MWDWLWPALLGEVIFAANMHLALSGCGSRLVGLIFLSQALLLYRLHRTAAARLWFLAAGAIFSGMAFFMAGWGLASGWYWAWPAQAPAFFFLLAVFGAAGGITWWRYTPLMQMLLEADCKTGRFNLREGIFRLTVLPSFYEFKTPVLRGAAELLLPFSGLLIAVAMALSVPSDQPLARGVGRVLFGGFSLVLASLFVIVAVCAFYTHRWILHWERQEGKTMRVRA